MASPVGVSAFVTNDSLKFILPTFLVLGLLVPFVSPRVDPESLLLVAVFTGMILTPLVGNGYLRLVRRIYKPAKSSSRQKDRGNQRWKYDRMIYSIANDERNAIMLSDARSTFTLLMSASFGAFALASLIHLPLHIAPPGGALNGEYLAKLATVPIPLLGGAAVPVWVAVVFGMVICVGAIKQHFRQQFLLFGVEYPELARKTHIAKKDVAKAVWGSVKPFVKGQELSAELQSAAGEFLASADVDEDGEFTFDVHPDSIIGDKIKIAVTGGETPVTQEFSFNKESIPEFRVSMPATDSE